VSNVAAPKSGWTEAAGRLGKALCGLFMKRAAVVAIDDVAGRLRLIKLRGIALHGVNWVPWPGLQTAMGTGFASRTYSPID
jgi:hypothetical protein